MSEQRASVSMGTEIIPRTTIVEIAANRDAALKVMSEAVEQMASAHKLALTAEEFGMRAHGASTFTTDHGRNDYYRRLFASVDPQRSLEAYRKQLDARVWMHVLLLTGMSNLMDRTAREQLDKDLSGDVPHFSADAARQVFSDLLGDAKLIFQRGLARCFSDLDRRFKSHDAFKLGSRIILTRVFDAFGMWNYHSKMEHTLADIERVFAVLDGKQADPGALCRAIREGRRGHCFDPHQSVTETPYFRVRCFQNGNAHLWFLRDDLVEKANKVLADYYGEVLPDAARPDDSPDDLRSKAGLPARDLSFYPTPDAVTKRCMDRLGLQNGARVLEPSAGTGNMVVHLLASGARVDAVEIDPDRCATLRRLRDPALMVIERNFLTMPAEPVYAAVLMNPPFFGTHWMEHVVHAYDFLAPGGTLVAVLPISADFGSSKKHETFRAWAKERTFRRYDSLFEDLPTESFAASGTRISTVILTLRRER